MVLNRYLCRELVCAAFAQHPSWKVRVAPARCASGAEEEPQAEPLSSLLVWAEYERIAWDQVYEGACLAKTSICHPEVHKQV